MRLNTPGLDIVKPIAVQSYPESAGLDAGFHINQASDSTLILAFSRPSVWLG